MCEQHTAAIGWFFVPDPECVDTRRTTDRKRRIKQTVI